MPTTPRSDEPREGPHLVKTNNGYVSQREHDLLDDKVERYNQMMTVSQAETKRDFRDALSLAQNTVQSGLDKAAQGLAVSGEKTERNQQIALEAAEKRVNEKFIVQKEASDKAESVMNDRIVKIERSQDQFIGERATYVTRDQIDLIIKSVSGDIRPLQSSQDTGKGREIMTTQFLGWLIAIAAILVSFLIHFPK